MKLHDIQLPSLSNYSGDIFEPTSATLACMHAPSSSNIEHQVAVEFREACYISAYISASDVIPRSRERERKEFAL